MPSDLAVAVPLPSFAYGRKTAGAPAPEFGLQPADPVMASRAVIAELVGLADVTLDTWRAELRQISLAAAAHGDFKSSVDGYKEIGKSLGAVSEAPAQHLHLHGDELKEASVEQIQARLTAVRSKLAAARAAPPPTPATAGVPPDRPLTPAEEAELEEMLR